MPTFFPPPYEGPMLGLDAETGLITPEVYEITSELEDIRIARRRAAGVMKEELPFKKPFWLFRPKGRETTSEHPAQYHFEEESDPLGEESNGQDVVAWLRGEVGGQTRALYIQEQKQVGEKVLLVARPVLRAVTFDRGEEPTDLSYSRKLSPRFYEEHLSLKQQREAVSRVLNVLALLRKAQHQAEQ